MLQESENLVAIPDRTANKTHALTDIQKQPDHRGIHIQQVGIEELKYPIQLVTQTGSTQPSVAVFSLSISLSAVQKGAHLSRFIEILEASPRFFSSNGEGLETLLDQIQMKLNAPEAFLNMSFPFFMKKAAPKTQSVGSMDYAVTFRASKQGSTSAQWETVVQVPVTSVCPCSKAIARHGAHNQRSLLTLIVQSHRPVAVEHWIQLLEQQGSAELFSLLKRPDEKWVTEQAYKNAKFVEDMVRDVAMVLNQDKNVCQYHLTSKNLESIHNHTAFATIFSKPHLSVNPS